MTWLLLITGIAAGFLGSLTGLGGAILVLPALTLLFKIPFSYAAGAGLLAAIATSSSSAAIYVRERLSNIRIGMSLEAGTTLGALVGALLAALVYRSHLESWLFILFGLVLLTSVVQRTRHLAHWHSPQPDGSTEVLQLRGSYYDAAERMHISYCGIRWGWGELVMCVAGMLSGLLGVGSGALKVIALDNVMGLPPKVSTATSNFMVGVTAAVSAAVYWQLGYIQPHIAGTVTLGVVIGALIGAYLFKRLGGTPLRVLFTVVIAILAMQMIVRGVHLL
jgi:uncharacterized membrane protein YfcA